MQAFFHRGALFGPRAEIFNLMLPFGFMAAALVAVALGHSVSSSDRALIDLVRNFIFLDAVHTLFTFLILAVLPEPRRMVVQAFHERRSWVLLSLLLLLAVFSFEFLPYFIHLDQGFSLLAMGILFGLSQQHVGGQIFGLSTLYNRKALKNSSLTSAQAATYEALQQREEWAFEWFNRFIWLIPLSLDRVYGVGRIVLPIHAVLATILVGLILWTSWRMHRLAPSNKIFYQCRLVLWILAPVHPLLTMGVASFHAIEYLFITQKMVEKSIWRKTVQRVAMVLIGCFLVYPFLRQYVWTESWNQPWFLILLMAFFRALDFTHYYLDGVIFRMRNAETRRWIAPLLPA